MQGAGDKMKHGTLILFVSPSPFQITLLQPSVVEINTTVNEAPSASCYGAAPGHHNDALSRQVPKENKYTHPNGTTQWQHQCLTLAAASS